MRFPRLSLARQEQLVRFGRSTGDPATALRCLMVAKLGYPKMMQANPPSGARSHTVPGQQGSPET